MKLQPPTPLVGERCHRRAPRDKTKIGAEGEPPWTKTKKRSSCFSLAPTDISVGNSFHLQYDVGVAFELNDVVAGLETNANKRLKLWDACSLRITMFHDSPP